MSHFVYFLPPRTGMISIQLFSVYHVHIQCLISNLEFCTSFAIRQQWLPPGVTNCMVFNFKPVLYLKVVENYHITCHTNRQIFLVSLSTLCSHNWVAAIVISAFGCHLTNLTLMTLICLSVYCLFYYVGILLGEN